MKITFDRLKDIKIQTWFNFLHKGLAGEICVSYVSGGRYQYTMQPVFCNGPNDERHMELMIQEAEDNEGNEIDGDFVGRIIYEPENEKEQELFDSRKFNYFISRDKETETMTFLEWDISEETLNPECVARNF